MKTMALCNILQEDMNNEQYHPTTPDQTPSQEDYKSAGMAALQYLTLIVADATCEHVEKEKRRACSLVEYHQRMKSHIWFKGGERRNNSVSYFWLKRSNT